MIIAILGWVMCSLAIVVFAFKLLVLYGAASDSQGGGGAPTLDGVIFPPIFLSAGLGLLDMRYSDLSLPGWSYVCIWIVGTVLIYLLHELIYRVVHSRALKKMERHDTET
jgi:hypothetical protein